MSQIEIRHLSKSFGSKKVLDDINLFIEKGDVYGILGESGAGKSTLVRCINGLETMDEGEILYEGRVLTSPSVKIARSDRMRLAMIFQSINLLQQKTALQNVLVALSIKKAPFKERKAKAISLLERVGLGDKVNSYPSQLSGGQCQRVAIARALALDPEVILSDEATSALDPVSTQEILELLSSLNKEYGLTIIMISHQMNAIEEICNKVAIIDEAKIVEEGELGEVFLNPKAEASKRLLYQKEVSTAFSEDRLIRILFDGNVDEPLLAEMVLTCSVGVSIVYADCKVVEDKTYGQTIVKRPKEEKEAEKILRFLTLKGVKYEEVEPSC